MAIIYTYPRIGTLDLQDLMIISDLQTEGNPTKTVTLGQLTSFIKGTPTGGLGTTNYVPKWIDGPNSILGDSPMFTFDGGAGLKQVILTDGYRFVVDRDAATTVGDPEYAITQNGVNKTSFGWDDDGGGFGFLYNWAGKGFKFGSTALYPQFEILTDPDIKNITFADFEFDADIIDITGSVGTAGQVLSSLGAGNGVEWVAGGTVTGTGTTNRLTKWSAPVGSGQIEDSSIEDTGSQINVPYTLSINNATSNADGIVFPHPAGGASANVNFYFAGAGAGSRFVISRGATGGPEIELESGGNVNINRTGNGNFFVGGEVTFDDYGSGTITGTPTFNLEVDANGKIIETASGGGGGIGGTGTINTLPVFTAATTLGDSIYVQNAGATIGTVNGERLVLGDGTANTVDFLINTTGAAGDVVEIQSQGQQIIYHEKGTSLDIGTNNDIVIDDSGVGGVTLTQPTTFQSDIIDINNLTGVAGQVLASLGGGGAGVEWQNPGSSGYKAVQVFQWTAGNPVAYTNFIIGGGTSALPFDNVPLVEQGTWPGAPAGANNYAWLCVNQAGGTATQFATFTLGPNGAGTWQIDTCQQWFDQNQFLEVNVDIRIVGTATAFCVINQRVNDGAGDRIYQGNLVREFAAGDAVQVEITFANGTGSNPFPSAAQNRPIEVTFTKLV